MQSPELEDMLQFAQEEKSAYLHRERVEAAAQQAQRLMSAEEYEQAISFLRATLKEITDEELEIILVDAEGHVEDVNRRVLDATETAERLLRVDRAAEAVRFLDSQPASFAENRCASARLPDVPATARNVSAISMEPCNRCKLQSVPATGRVRRRLLSNAVSPMVIIRSSREWRLRSQQGRCSWQ